ncbi:hypothetical protein MHU86_8465 [Fragilaria crotonensis]|nr:hypothetical protein MHU86_8465 [Fragilaria crotonensis]
MTSAFPSDSVEKTGHWAGIAEHHGDVLTYLELTDDILQVIACSNVCFTLSPMHSNLGAYGRLPSNGGNDLIQLNVVDQGDLSDMAGGHIDPSELKLPYFRPDGLLNCTFLHNGDGQQMRAHVAG